MWSEFSPLLTGVGIGFLFVVLERLAPARPRSPARWRRYATDLLHMTVGTQLIQLGTIALLALVLLLPLFAGGAVLAAGALPWWLQLMLVLLISDLVIWLVHRLFHAVPWLWEFHKIHHSSKDLDWLAAYRFHPVDQILTASAVALPGMVLGFSPSAVAAYTLGYGLHSVLLHANVKFSLGPFSQVINVPRTHHWHHADHVEAYDRNFGAQLLIWDRLFGTLYNPQSDLPERYGVDDAPEESFIGHLQAPFARRAARKRAAAAVCED